MGADIGSFIRRLTKYNSITYFHNLKFDGMFIVDWLLNHDFQYAADAPSRKEFTSLISDTAKFYSITVKWSNGHTTEFRDSLKKLPMSVRRIAETFKMPIGKGDIDYDAPRPVGHELTNEEKDYLQRDVTIVATAMQEVLASGMTGLTVASDSMAEYKRLVNKKAFIRIFPVFSEEMDAEIRKALRGGFTYADDRFMKRQVGHGMVFDVNSLYPSVMLSKYLPYGEPEWQDGKVAPTATHPLTIFSITFTAKIKPNHIPCIQIKGSSQWGATEYLKNIDVPTTLMVTDVDLALYQDQYDVNIISYNGGWRFKAAMGMFDTYIDKWGKVKETTTGGKRAVAKLHLNSLWGKYTANPNVTGKIPTLENGIVKLVKGPEETRPPIYTAVGVFITSYARDLTVRAAQASYDVFAYADTDSLHLLTDTPPTGLEVHPTKMGAWKKEYEFEAAYYVRPKVYLERHADGSYTNRVAGLPERVSETLTLDSLIDGTVLHGKLNPKTVPGGVVLKDVPFQLNL